MRRPRRVARSAQSRPAGMLTFKRTGPPCSACSSSARRAASSRGSREVGVQRRRNRDRRDALQRALTRRGDGAAVEDVVAEIHAVIHPREHDDRAFAARRGRRRRRGRRKRSPQACRPPRTPARRGGTAGAGGAGSARGLPRSARPPARRSRRRRAARVLAETPRCRSRGSRRRSRARRAAVSPATRRPFR